MMKKCPLDDSDHPDHREDSEQYNRCEEAQRRKMRQADEEDRAQSTRDASIHRLLAAPAVVDVHKPASRRDSMAEWVTEESVVDKLARLANCPSQRTSGPGFEM